MHFVLWVMMKHGGVCVLAVGAGMQNRVVICLRCGLVHSAIRKGMAMCGMAMRVRLRVCLRLVDALHDAEQAQPDLLNVQTCQGYRPYSDARVLWVGSLHDVQHDAIHIRRNLRHGSAKAQLT